MFSLLLGSCTAMLTTETQYVLDDSTEGYVEYNGKFLTCSSSSCSWNATPQQIFKRTSGDDGKYRFQILNADGVNSGQCLNREHCHSKTSNARMGSCSHCGSVHWDYGNYQLAEDKMKNCIQDDGNIEHCDQSFARVTWPFKPDCKVESQTITDVKCKSTTDSGACGASISADSSTGSISSIPCTACEAPEGSTLECDFNFAITTSKSVTTQWAEKTSISVGTEFKVETNWEVVDAQATVKVTVTEDLTYGKATTSSSTTTSGSLCRSNIKAGTAAVAGANFFTGTLVGDFTATLTTYWDCDWKDASKEETTATITITNVPTQSLNGSCELKAVTCKDTLRQLMAPRYEA